MFKRKVYNELLEWKNRYNGKYAVLLEGARRVGKTTVAKEFAKDNYKSCVFIDFSIASKELLGIFDYISNLDEFFLRLQTITGKKLYKRQTVIIFDEVQFFPKARQAIKHLVADGRYDYIETGSLISIRQNVKDILIPSEEHKIKVFPLDFEEFLWALGVPTFDIIKQFYYEKRAIDDISHRAIMRLFRLYIAVGGMPQAVAAYVENNNFSDCDRVKKEILELYQDDLRKIDSSGLISAIYLSIPSQLSLKKNRFVISSATGKQTTNKDRERLYNLIDSQTVLLCQNICDIYSPLNTIDYDKFKLYISDTGLFVTMLFNNMLKNDKLNCNDVYKKLISDKDLNVNLGFLYENIFAQILASKNIPLYYHTWRKKDSTHEYEIDFVVSQNAKVLPIEIKSSNLNQHKSLDEFMKKNKEKVQTSYIFSQKNTRLQPPIVNIPIYMAMVMFDN